MRRYRNGDVAIQTLRRKIVEDPSDLSLRIALSRSLQRSGVGVEDPEVAIGVIASNLDSGLIDLDRVNMGARVGYEPARAVLEAKGQEVVGEGLDWADWNQRELIILVISQREMANLAADFAEDVLDVFEAIMPKDDRPEEAIEAARHRMIPSAKDDVVRRANLAANRVATSSDITAWAAAAAARSAASAASVTFTAHIRNKAAAVAAAASTAVAASLVRTDAATTHRFQLSRYLCYLLKLDPACILPPV